MPLGHIMRLDLERLALEYVVPCLHDIGFCYLDNFLGEVVGDCVLERVKRMHRDGELADGQLAGPSRGVAKRHLRGDQIKWIGGTEEGCEAINFLLTLIDRLVMYCGSRLGKYYVKERSKWIMSEDLAKMYLSWIQSSWYEDIDILAQSDSLAQGQIPYSDDLSACCRNSGTEQGAAGCWPELMSKAVAYSVRPIIWSVLKPVAPQGLPMKCCSI
ncbi:prolyl hydroxylase EGLN3 isoform X2 [Centrocercus urophasianus]|uniref:prolyl hydroxylase EGLN3 isoform X2 n=1 Tax=Centrocercus urophasianus TaxID=9002 RepID=UPI001C64F590|nr:prolyl hydroxylase EGLN3 isoform X2 [Centrocercus urophasianus]